MLRYTAAWERYVTRQGRWVDFENDYKTMDASYMESVIWAFKTLYDRGLIYEGLPRPPVLLGVRDAALELRDAPGRRLPRARRPGGHRRGLARRRSRRRDRTGRRARCAPSPGRRRRGRCPRTWRSRSGRSITYAIYERDGVRYLVGESRAAEPTAPELAGAVLVGTVEGRELVGRTYRPLFDYFAGEPNAFRVLGG